MTIQYLEGDVMDPQLQGLGHTTCIIHNSEMSRSKAIEFVHAFLYAEQTMLSAANTCAAKNGNQRERGCTSIRKFICKYQTTTVLENKVCKQAHVRQRCHANK